MPTRLTSIIIPCWNQAEYTEACLAALAANTPRGVEYELVLIDNGSTDRTPDLLARWPSLSGAAWRPGTYRVIRNEANLGFARACNQGASEARGEYLLFLNNDTAPQPGWLEPLVDALDADPRTAAAGSLLLYPDGTVQHSGIGFLANGVPRHWNHRADPASCEIVFEPRELQAVTGACLLVRRAVFEDQGGFDEAFVNGVEDIDLCLKLRAEGWKVRYEPASVLTHVASVSPRREADNARNGSVYLSRWAPRVLPDMRRLELLAEGKQPRVSALVATLDDAETIAVVLELLCRCLSSRDEIVVVDRGSHDATLEILARWAREDQRVALWRLDQLGERREALDVGLRRAAGELFLVVRPDVIRDSGDPWVERALTAAAGRWLSDMEKPLAAPAVGAVSLAADALSSPELEGGCVLIPRPVLEQVGLFGADPYTQIDGLGDRIRAAGFEIVRAGQDCGSGARL